MKRRDRIRARLAVAAAAVAAAAGCAKPSCDESCPLASERARAASGPPAEFAALDANRDGLLQLSEAPAAARMFYGAADADRDGALTLDEWRGFNDDPGGARRVPLPENVEWIADLPYADTDNPRQRLDVYLPRERKVAGPLPVIAYVHGGAWRMGSRVMARPDVAPHVATGRYAAVSIGYRLSGEATWPAQIHDAKAGIRWIRAHAAEYGFDPNRICVMGSSAGGHLAAEIGTTNGVAEVEGTLGPHRGQRSDVQCAVDLFGPTDLTVPEPESRRVTMAGQPASREKLLGGAIGSQPALERQASPLYQVDRGDPPFHILHGTRDPLVAYQDSVNLDRALRAAGVTSHLQTIEGGGHGDFQALPEVGRRIGLFLEQTLHGSTVAVPTDVLRFPAPATPSATR
jgi:acetyl esterase/lipase